MSQERVPYICQSQSLNIFVEKADPRIINSVHLYGHSLGLKTGSYYIRTKPVLSTQNFSMDYKIEQTYNKSNNNDDNSNNSNNSNNGIDDNYEPCLNCSS